MDIIDEHFIHPITMFIRNSRMLLKACEKPDYDEFSRNIFVIGMGLLILGFTGYIVKICFIPINNVILGA